jgi:uncharacterized repeat protein (TIGR01451 family)
VASSDVSRARLALAFTAIFLCSCRAVPQGAKVPQPPSEATLISRASAERVANSAERHPNMPAECIPSAPVPMPMTTVSPWAPPGIAGPWPHDEYLCDGGDQEVQVNVGPQRDIRGLELEDTVAVYETLEGETKIEPSNKVCLYAPRFAAVRQVSGVAQSEQRDQPIGVERPIGPTLQRRDELATTAVQPLRPEGEIGRKQPSIERVGESAVPATSRQPIMALQGGFAPHENFMVIRCGILQDSERARLAESVTNAITWTHDKALQVVLDGVQAVDFTGEQKAQATFRVDTPNKPCLRVLKVASTKVAKPGDIVDFTIRFDNLGDQAIAKVVLIDNLTTRLEYVTGTAQSSRPAEFTTDANEGESLVLRWEFADPLPAGHGGLVRFHCRVR